MAIKDGKVFKELAKRVHQPVFMPLRAMATVALVPPLLAMFGIRKNKSDNSPKQENNNQSATNLTFLNNLPTVSKLDSVKGGN